MMNYKGYNGVLRVDDDERILRGKVINIRDTITFQGKTVEEAEAAFRDSVDDYLEFCESHGQSPEKPTSGKFMVRLPPEIHRELIAIAETRGTSLNKLVKHQLSRYAEKHYPTKSGAKLVVSKTVGPPKPQGKPLKPVVVKAASMDIRYKAAKKGKAKPR